MSGKTFPRDVVEDLLVKCHRHCCLCHKFCGTKIEIHHIDPKGPNTEDNGIPLCFDCHAEVRAYDTKHPKGRKFTPSELKKHRDQWFYICARSPFTPLQPILIEVEPPTLSRAEVEHPLEGQNIRIGVTSSSTAELETTLALIGLAKTDINEYVKKLGLNIAFEFVVSDNKGTAAIALENTKTFKTMDINLIIGHGWSSQCQVSLSYANENDMILLSPSSTSPILAIADDALFRTCPNDFVQSPALAEMWYTWGARAVLTMHRGDAWGDGLWNILEGELEKRGIENLGQIGYAGDVTEFSNYLATANDIITEAIAKYGVERVGMQFFSFAELRAIQTQAAVYTNLINIIWMTTESGGRSQAMLDAAGEWATKTKHFSPFMTPVPSQKWDSFKKRYFAATGLYPGLYSGTMYDAIWIIALSVLQTGSSEGRIIKNIIRNVAANYFGITGWCNLDENGDRMPQIFDIWGFYEEPTTREYKYRKFGEYDGRAIEVMWDYHVLEKYAGLTPLGP